MLSEQINEFGLSERNLKTIADIFAKYSEVKQVNIFGSRSLNKYRQGSDIDLAIMNKGVSEMTLRQIQAAFDESSLPYRIDLINYPTLDHVDISDHINRAGKAFYNK